MSEPLWFYCAGCCSQVEVPLDTDLDLGACPRCGMAHENKTLHAERAQRRAHAVRHHAADALALRAALALIDVSPYACLPTGLASELDAFVSGGVQALRGRR